MIELVHLLTTELDRANLPDTRVAVLNALSADSARVVAVSSGENPWRDFQASFERYTGNSQPTNPRPELLDSQHEHVFKTLFHKAQTQYSTERDSLYDVHADSLNQDQIAAIFEWASGTNIGLSSELFAQMIAPGNQNGFAGVLDYYQEHPDALERLKQTHALIIETLTHNHLLSKVEAEVIGNTQMIPLSMWFRIEANPEEQNIPRQGFASDLTGLMIFSSVSSQAMTEHLSGASRLATLGRQIGALPLSQRLSFGEYFLQAYDEIRTKHFGDEEIKFERNQRTNRFMNELAHRLEKFAANER